MTQQRKLTDDELGDVMIARGALQKTWQSFDNPDCLRDTVIHLGKLALNATTDGKPRIDPEPPIPDGYRKAVASDEGRADCKFLGTMGWMDRESCRRGMAFEAIYRYIVPIDREPTDEDAKSRPEVMVRDSEHWQKAVLYGVLENNVYSFLVVSQGTSGRFKYCRHLYPGE